MKAEVPAATEMLLLAAPRPTRASPYDLRWFVQSLTLFVACIVANEIAFALYAPPAVFPLAAGVAFAGVVLGGYRLLPAVFLATFLGYFLHSLPPSLLVLLSVGNTLQAAVGAYALRSLLFDPLLRRMRDIFMLLGACLVVSSIVPTTVLLGNILTVRLGGTALPITWTIYWTGHIFSLLIVSPLIARWIAKPFFSRTWLDLLETLGAFALLLFADYLTFWSSVPAIGGVPFVYFLLIPLFWIALRLNARFMSLGIALTSLIALLGVLSGPASAIATAPLGQRLYLMQLFLIVIAVIYYILVSIQSERRFAISTLRQQLSRLENALIRISEEDSEKTEFLAVLAHELRNPLAPMLSALELLKMKGVSAIEADRMIDMMNGRVRTMSRLLDDLLDISRISRKKLKLQTEAVSLQKTLKRSVAAVNELSIDKTHVHELHMPAQDLVVQADAVRLEQIFVNVLKNAVKYTDPGGHISIALTRQGESAVVRIRDNGVGIDKAMLEKIFEPFVQADIARASRGGTGLGIGLSLTKMLVEMHGGSIEAKSAGKGKGSEFILCLPLPSRKPVPEVHGLATPIQGNSTRRVLVVDDNAAAADGIEKLLKHKGHDAKSVYTGMEAISKSKGFDPDFIFLDIGLPDIDGYEVARVLRVAEGFTGKLVALTGYGMDQDKDKAYDAGFDYHLTKPVSFGDLESLLQK